MNHTKGKWKEVGAFVMSENGIDICSTCSVNSLPLKEQIANARLIAAAPDLLAACKAAQLMLLQTDWNGDDRMNIVRDAIAKAE